jgi:hypothetical protein
MSTPAMSSWIQSGAFALIYCNHDSERAAS